jgi:hypothetical protein
MRVNVSAIKIGKKNQKIIPQLKSLSIPIVVIFKPTYSNIFNENWHGERFYPNRDFWTRTSGLLDPDV